MGKAAKRRAHADGAAVDVVQEAADLDRGRDQRVHPDDVHVVEQRGLERLGLVGLGLGLLEGVLATDVAGELEDRGDRLGRLGADAEPVLGPVRDDLDVGGVLGGVVLADLLDDAAVALLAGVDDDDAVVRRTDLAHTLQTNLDGHGCGVSLGARGW